MSYFDDASLVFIPSGTKTSKAYSVKPIDGTGDLTFTRSNDTATRVASNGLIEKVRTNLLLQSNGFNTASWSKSSSGAALAPVITANAGTAPDGTNNAFRVQFNCVGTTSSDRSILNQSITSVNSTPHTSSVYIKAFSAGEVGKQVRFVTEQSGSQIIITLTADWQRVINVGTSVATSLNFLLETRGGFTTNTAADVLLAFAQLETGDIATDYIPTTSAAVSVGPVANVPRLDYLNSSCPRLLLEPQRTNLATQSENFNGWSFKVNVTTTANYAVSPDGYTNADRLQFTGAGFMYGATGFIQTNGTTYTLSCYAKRNGSGTQSVGFFVNGSGVVNSAWTLTSEWQRFTYTYTASNNSSVGIAGANGADVSVYGFQFEAGAYATSYIPTLGAAVTRGADAASKTGISSLIGQTEGTIYLEADIQKRNESGFYVAISAGAVLATSIYLFQPSSGSLQVLIRNTGNPDGSITINSANWTAGFNKVAIAYTATTAEVFINGVSKGSTSFVSLPALSQLTLGARPDVTGSLVGAGPYSQALLFKTRLTNAQLAELTSL